MIWNDLISSTQVMDRHGRVDIEVRGIQYDSRRVCAGDVFVAMRGGATDGNRFVQTALQAGAAALVTDTPEVFDELKRKQPELALALVEHGRRALATLSAMIFGHPEQSLRLSAVTGTNGKTTTAFLLEQMLRSAGTKNVLIGTIETRVGDVVHRAEHTTPESRDTLAFFAEGVRSGCTEAVMEFSSHALEQERVWGLPVDVAIFTNLTQDHLDYHGSMGAYARSKAKLFRGAGAAPPRVAVINADDPWASTMINAFSGATLWQYGLGSTSPYRAEEIEFASGETRFTLCTPEGSVVMRSPLSGRVNVYNLLAASCAALARGLTLGQLSAATPKLAQVPGRFQVVEGSRGGSFSVVVDYAHTDDALRNLIALARDLVKASGGRVITLFGCGGDRDRTKRPKMGRVAGEGSDLVVVTSDNPRSEDPNAILAEVLAGVRQTGATVVAEPDRRVAIAVAIGAARPGDLVLLAGKGHEKVQIFAGGAVAFDDVREAELVLERMKSGRSPKGAHA